MHERRNEQRTYDEVLADAVRVLTEAACRVITWTDRDGRARHEQADFAEFVTHGLAGAAANIGGIEPMLAGRPRSLEADHLRDVLCATVGYDEQFLLERRTESVIVRVHVSAILGDLGIWTLYEQAYDELERRDDLICAASPYPKPISQEHDAELGVIDELRAALHAQRLREWAAYGAAFRANVLRAAGELFPTLPVPVEVIVELDRKHERSVGDERDGPVWRLWEAARSSTPLPGSDIPLQDYPPRADIAQIERDAGRDPLTRLRRGEARR
jgi:hypothetical protein